MATRLLLQAALLARTGTGDTTIAQAAINDAYKELVGRFHLNPAEVVLPLTAGTDGYDFNALLNAAVGQQDYNGLIELYGVDSTSNVWPIQQCDLSHLIKLRGSAQSTGQPTDFALVGLTGFEVYPVPTSGWSLTVWYDRWRPATNALNADGDIPVLIPDAYHDVIELLASKTVVGRYESMGENASVVANVNSLYQARLAELSQILRNRQGKQTRQMRVGYRRFARIRPAVPSQDLGGRWA